MAKAADIKISLISGRYSEATDLRAKELKIEDVYKEGKHWVMNIRESDETKIKTQSSERIIPVHSQLIKLRFHEYVKTLRDMGKERVFRISTFQEVCYTTS